MAAFSTKNLIFVPKLQKQMKKLPIGIQTFSKLREDDFIYVDKTEYIYNIISGNNYYFLSRPRRFGKSLTLSTIAEIYSGNKNLFTGLWIENNWDWDKIHPIIHIAFNRFDYLNLGLDYVLTEALHEQAALHGLVLLRKSPSQLFEELIQKLVALKGRVVILIDEYDKPIIDFLEDKNLHIAQKNREILRNFYSIVKNADPYIEFFLMTGVSKFSQTGIFSNLNHLNDITLNKKYAALTGYTQSDLVVYFNEYIQEALPDFAPLNEQQLLEQIKKWYNGYSWDAKTSVYNPYSVLLFLDNRAFENYWFASGTPTFLIDLIKQNKIFDFNQITASRSLLDSYEPDNLDVRTLLFQTGYLTIKHIDIYNGIYTLDYPNREVEQSMHDYLIAALLDRKMGDSPKPVFDVVSAFHQNNIERVIAIINSLLKDVPALLINAKNEHFYHSLVHLHFRYLGLLMDSEVHTSDGRMDAVVKTNTHIYILEFKIDQSAEIALNQIKNKVYYSKYTIENKTVVGIGINFDTEKRAISQWQQETLIDATT
jgi:hypothetical protein